MEQSMELGDSSAAHPVIGVGDVHGGDAQEVNEGCVVAASTQRAHAAGGKMDGLEAAGPARPPAHPGPGRPRAHLGTRPCTGLLRLKYRTQLS